MFSLIICAVIRIVVSPKISIQTRQASANQFTWVFRLYCYFCFGKPGGNNIEAFLFAYNVANCTLRLSLISMGKPGRTAVFRLFVKWLYVYLVMKNKKLSTFDLLVKPFFVFQILKMELYKCMHNSDEIKHFCNNCRMLFCH